MPKNRIDEEWQRLKELSQRAGFWNVAPVVDADDGSRMIAIEINGLSIAEAGPGDHQVKYCERQKIRMVLPPDFPGSPPGLHVDSPVFHPNIAADGLVELKEIELSWSPDLTLDLVLERLWDTLRAIRFDSRNAIQIGAGQWYLQQAATTGIQFPVDKRPLCGSKRTSNNVIRYRKHGELFRQIPARETLEIGESTTPQSIRPQSTLNSPIHFIDQDP